MQELVLRETAKGVTFLQVSVLFLQLVLKEDTPFCCTYILYNEHCCPVKFVWVPPLCSEVRLLSTLFVEHSPALLQASGGTEQRVDRGSRLTGCSHIYFCCVIIITDINFIVIPHWDGFITSPELHRAWPGCRLFVSLTQQTHSHLSYSKASQCSRLWN